MTLNEQTIVITGAAGVLGQAVAKTAKSYGARVIGLDIVDEPAVDDIDQYHKLDLLDEHAIAQCVASLGNIHALINVAGGFAMGLSAYDPSDEQWDRMFRLNVSTCRNITRAVVPRLQDQGRGAIVNIGALGALSGQGAMSAYCCAKSTVMRLTESLAEELKHSGINVNAVLPSIIDTPQNRLDMPDANFEEWVSPQKLAEVICFLASDAASAVHGALIPVRGLV